VKTRIFAGKSSTIQETLLFSSSEYQFEFLRFDHLTTVFYGYCVFLVVGPGKTEGHPARERRFA
jgi:hypothetical protein